MTNAQKAQQAILHLRQTSKTYQEWLRFPYKKGERAKTNWGKAIRLLDEIAGHIPPSPPPVPPASAFGKRCVYFSAVSDDACSRFAALGSGYTALLTADPNPAYHVTDAQIAMLKSGGGVVGTWCDGDSTPISAAQEMARTRGLAYASGQYETPAQYDLLIASGVPLGIGNPSVLDDARLADAIRRVNAGTLALIGEVMQPDPNYSARGIPIASACFYCDRDAAQGGYLELDAYAGMPAGMRATCSLYTGGAATPDTWNTFAAWTRPF